MNNYLLTLALLLPALVLADPGRTVDIRVVDENGMPVRAAHVLVHSGKENDVTSSGRHGFRELTDDDGRWSHQFKPKWGLENLRVFLHEEQPDREVYPIWLEHFISYRRPQASYELTLPRIIHPVNLKAKVKSMDYRYKRRADGTYEDLSTPLGTPIGFDLDLMQWLPPHGDGKRADFEVSVTSVQVGWTISEEWLAHKIAMKRGTREELAATYGVWNRTAVITFPNPGDGIQRSAQFWPYCKLKMPHRAPEDGYQRRIVLTEQERISEATPYFEKLQHPYYSGYFLRVRSKLDGVGNVVSANYAKFMLPQIDTAGFGATFFFNPVEGDTNLEYSGVNLLPRPVDSKGVPIQDFNEVGYTDR